MRGQAAVGVGRVISVSMAKELSANTAGLKDGDLRAVSPSEDVMEAPGPHLTLCIFTRFGHGSYAGRCEERWRKGSSDNDWLDPYDVVLGKPAQKNVNARAQRDIQAPRAFKSEIAVRSNPRHILGRSEEAPCTFNG